VANALRASEELLQTDTSADFSPIREQLQRLEEAELKKRNHPDEKKSSDEEPDPRDVPLPPKLVAHAGHLLELFVGRSLLVAPKPN
jgi:hypothetical protein